MSVVPIRRFEEAIVAGRKPFVRTPPPRSLTAYQLEWGPDADRRAKLLY
jgi:hypothetical protein